MRMFRCRVFSLAAVALLVSISEPLHANAKHSGKDGRLPTVVKQEMKFDHEYRMRPDNDVLKIRSGLGLPPLTDNKAVYWIRHEQVGIGNTFGGYAAVCISDVLLGGRTFVFNSRILQKFHAFVPCTITVATPGEQRWLRPRGADVRTAADYFIKLNGGHSREEELAMRPIYEAAGCALPNMTAAPSDFDANVVSQPFAARAREGRVAAAGRAPKPARPLHHRDPNWPRRCLYSRLVRSLIVGGPGGRLEEEKEWLRSYYVGDSGRFERVMAVDKFAPELVFEFSIHIRTLDLIEDVGTEDGRPLDVNQKSSAFIESTSFQAMVSCFAAQIASEARAQSRANPARQVRVYLATDAMQVRVPFALGLARQATQLLNGQSVAPGEDPRKVFMREGGAKDDALANARDFAKAAAAAAASRQRSRGAKGRRRARRRLGLVPERASAVYAFDRNASSLEAAWSVEVDYFSEDLEPSMFFDWTEPMHEVREETWQRLAGTTAEWLFLAQGRTMLTVKGTRGGERALPSSFALSAAAFGRSDNVRYLRESKTAAEPPTEAFVPASLIRLEGAGGAKSSGELREGTRVEARYRGRGAYLPGVVKRVHDDGPHAGTFDVAYDPSGSEGPKCSWMDLGSFRAMDPS